MTARGRLLDRVPASLSLRIRAERNVRRLFGLHAPADLILGLVPPGRNAVDVGANRGIYTYWIGKRAVVVDAFEPQPALAAYIRRARLRNVRVHEVAISDRAGSAQLLVPSDDGLARLASTGGSDAVSVTADLEPGTNARLAVDTLPLDSFDLVDVGFLKIDVEGHELAVLRGAERTITESKPIVFVESEARHALGAPENVVELMIGRHGYRRAAFVRRWEMVDVGEFDLQRDQLGLLPDFMGEAYVSNFVFWP